MPEYPTRGDRFQMWDWPSEDWVPCMFIGRRRDLGMVGYRVQDPDWRSCTWTMSLSDWQSRIDREEIELLTAKE